MPVLDAVFKSRYFLYEKEAYQIGKRLLEQVTTVNSELEIAYQSFMFTDFDHYWRYLLTGQESSREEFNEQFHRLRKQFQENVPEILPSIDLPRALGDLSKLEILVV